MKNVAKCDTWCELQNPVNHRIFERKLRPKPLGRGHVCLGVTHRVAPLPHGGCVGGGDWPPACPDARPAQKRSPGDVRRDQWWLNHRLNWRAVVRPRRCPRGASRDPKGASERL